MLVQETTIPRPVARERAALWTVLSYLVIGIAVVVPRILDLGQFLNGDEALFWIRRSEAFIAAMRSGDYVATAMSTHPGVTTMWLGAAGLVLRNFVFDAGWVSDGSYQTWLTFVRLPLMLTHITGVMLGYAMLRRLMPPAVALLAGLLWALDPFIVGYSRIIHVDGLAATCIALSILASCLYWNHERRYGWLIFSGVCAGLAILSKSPSIALVPSVGILALSAVWREPMPLAARIRSIVIPLLIWGLCCGLTIFALWPALWVSPQAAYFQMRMGVDEGNSPHVSGNFFLGREMDVPGPLFYTVALPLRLTPWGLLGLFVLPLAYWQASRAQRRDMTALVFFVVLFTLALSILEKKLNRYLVPMWPLVDMLAAYGIVSLGGGLVMLLRRMAVPVRPVLINTILVALTSAGALTTAVSTHPYGIAYFNPVLGGLPVASHTFLMGTGEGLEHAAEWLNQQPDITDVRVVSGVPPALQPYLRKGARAISPDPNHPLPREVGYVVMYIRHLQREVVPFPFDSFFGRAVPLHVIKLFGMDYIWIYKVPPPVAQPRPATFGADIWLRGYEQESAALPGQPVVFKLFWETRNLPPSDYMLFAHLLGPDGKRYAQVDLLYPTRGWEPGRYATTELQIIVPADTPPGEYDLYIGLYDPASGQRLPLNTSEPGPRSNGADSLLLARVKLVK